MKRHIPGLIIVEGKSDENIIKSLFDTVVVKTNGYDIKEEDILFVNQIKQVLILTDSDKAGGLIRDRLNQYGSFNNIVLDISECNKNNKHGVAEANRDYLYKTLLPYSTDENNKTGLTKTDLYKLSLLGKSDSNSRRVFLSNKLKLGLVNSKTILERLNLLEITFDEIDNILREYGN